MLSKTIGKMKETDPDTFHEYVKDSGCDVYHTECPETGKGYILYETVDMKKMAVIVDGKYYVRNSPSFSNDAKINYIQGKGCVCPNCGEVDSVERSVKNEEISLKEGLFSAKAGCRECDAEWNDVFRLIRLEEE
jgi:hypothetical protein